MRAAQERCDTLRQDPRLHWSASLMRTSRHCQPSSHSDSLHKLARPPPLRQGQQPLDPLRLPPRLAPPWRHRPCRRLVRMASKRRPPSRARGRSKTYRPMRRQLLLGYSIPTRAYASLRPPLKKHRRKTTLDPIWRSRRCPPNTLNIDRWCNSSEAPDMARGSFFNHLCEAAVFTLHTCFIIIFGQSLALSYLPCPSSRICVPSELGENDYVRTRYGYTSPPPTLN